MTVSPATTSMPRQGGSQSFSFSVRDKQGKPVPDGTPIYISKPSAGELTGGNLLGYVVGTSQIYYLQVYAGVGSFTYTAPDYPGKFCLEDSKVSMLFVNTLGTAEPARWLTNSPVTINFTPDPDCP